MFAERDMELKPIGIIHTPFTDLAGMPIQPTGAVGVRGTVEVFEEYQTELKDLDGFSHIVICTYDTFPSINPGRAKTGSGYS